MTKVLVAIVLYNLDLSESIAYNSLNKCDNSKFLIYDNSRYVKGHYSDDRVVAYIHDPENGGLSKAYNYAAAFAKEHGYDWLLLADQDTFFPEQSLSVYISAIENNPRIKLFVPKVRVKDEKYMSPVRMRHYFTKTSKECFSGLIDPSKSGIINSGLLINVDAFWSVGGYNEKVWLDFADFQFIERFGSKYNEAIVIDLECVQSFSNEEQSVDQKLSRYKHFCTSVKHYEPIKKINKFWINLVVLKRAVSLCVQSKSLSPIIMYSKYYLL